MTAQFQRHALEVPLHDEYWLKKPWKNRDNADFYEHMPIEKLQQYAITIGLDDCIDVKLAKAYIGETDSIIEIGACYGRVLTGLIDLDLQGELFGVERSAKFFSRLKETFKGRATIYHADILSLEMHRTFNRVLWLWSGISDFSQQEHIAVMSRLSSLLSDNGLLIMDTFSHQLKPKNNNQVMFSNQSYIVKEGDYIARGYTPSCKEIEGYLDTLGLRLVHRISYKTMTRRDRWLHIISK